MVALADFSHQAGVLPLADLRTEAVTLLGRFINVERIAIWQRLPHTNGLLLAAGEGWARPQISHLSLDPAPNTGEFHVLRTGATVIMDAQTAPDVFVPVELLARERLVTAAHVPIGDEDHIHGVLSAYSGDNYRFTTDALSMMQLVAGVLKTAIRYNHSTDKTTRLTRNLRDAKQQINMLGDELKIYTHLVTHDLREPLRTIEGFAGFIHDDYKDAVNEEGAYMLQRMQELVGVVYDQLDALVELDRLTRSDLNRSTVDLSAIVETIHADLETAHPDRHVTWLIDQQIMVNGDRYLLRMALAELLKNAWTFTQGQEHAQISFGLTRYEDRQAFFVRDNGIGFDMHDRYQEFLFVPFRHLHTDEALIGRGLGLAIAQRVIHRHGGIIWAESAVDEGAIFYFTLPGIRVDVDP